MTAATQTPERDAPQGADNGPGRLLRNARESAGMTLRDVSAQMHLDERTLVSLEADEFQALPAPTFVRGYLRGYARLLGVPVGPVMEAYDREGFTPPDLVADIAEKPQARSGDIPVQLVTYVVGGVLLVLVMLWWNNQAFDDLIPVPAETSSALPGTGAAGGSSATAPEPATPAGPSADVAGATSPAGPALPLGTDTLGERVPGNAAPAPAAIPPLSGGASGAPMPAPGSTPEAPAPDAPGPGAPGPGAPGPEAMASVDRIIGQAEQVLERSRDEIQAAASRVGGDAPGGAGLQAAAGADTPASSPATPTAATPPPARTGSVAAPGSDGRLRLRFPEEAWVEVYDRNDARLFYNLVKPGRELDLKGETPLRVLLGRTQGVFVEYNGERVDLAPFTERGVARFTLGR